MAMTLYFVIFFKYPKCKSQYVVFYFLFIWLKNLLNQHLDGEIHTGLQKTRVS